ncbi:MAG TPA: hypothetical protein VM939_02605 [Gemmatimonadaceae bacterium]|nr:hypothetical protein [Gemmatimonadaceae bacterium]
MANDRNDKGNNPKGGTKPERVKDLPTKNVDQKQSDQVKGGRMPASPRDLQ